MKEGREGRNVKKGKLTKEKGNAKIRERMGHAGLYRYFEEGK